jgi:hypothetical protein
MKRKYTKWLTKPLNELTKTQWEQLCDRCGICCVHKVENQEGDVYLTDIACKHLEIQSVTCQCYHERTRNQKLCRVMTPDNIKDNLGWLPETCAYRRRFENRPLPNWHPLLSNGSDRLFKEGIDIRDKVISESLLDDIDWREHIVDKNYFSFSGIGSFSVID